MIGERLGQFRIDAMIGAGGMGVVYRAHDERLDRDVALKVLPPGTVVDETLCRRFRQEALALSRLNHPNIATVHDFNNHEGSDFLVMELIDGTTLDERLADAPLPERDILRFGVQIAQGLAVAHEHGVVHRDLKPGNVRVTPDGRVKILDFGLAALRHADWLDRAETAAIGERPLVVGSPPYMAPEQLLGEPVDPRSDIYAAGAVLYEMATGRRPFSDTQGPRLIEAILHQAPVPPREINAKLSPGLESIVLKALDKDPQRRYQSARELLVDLERLSVPLPPPPPRRARPAGRRTTVASGVALALLLLIGIGSGPGGVPGRATATEPAEIRSLAVLPLENRSGDPQQEYFADGMTDALIADLGRIASLRVVSRTSSMQYKAARKPLPQIARELGVDAVVEGSVLRAGARVRITAELIHARSDRHLWSESYERDARDVITLQREVARSVAREVQAKLTPQENRRLATPVPVDAETHELYLRGRYFLLQMNEPALRKAADYFRRAVERQAGFAAAHAGLADTHLLLTTLYGKDHRERPDEAYAAVRRSLDRALAGDPDLPEAHVTGAFASFVLRRDWAAAGAGFERALALNPNHARAHELYGFFLAARGRLEEALSEMKRAKELDPLNPVISAGIGRIFVYKRQLPLAIEQYQEALELQPDLLPARLGLGVAYMIHGESERATRELRRAVELSKDSPPVLADLAHAYVAAGKKNEAVKLLERWTALTGSGYRPYEQAAHVYAALGDVNKAIESLESAYKDQALGLVWLKVDPRFDSLRDDPRFKDLLGRLDLTS